MPRQSGLLLRGGRYYLNIRVPIELRPLYGKREIIRKSLDTSDYRTAVSKVRFEAFKLDSEFVVKRRELLETKTPRVAKVLDITDREAHETVVRFFTRLEKISDEWWEEKGSKLSHPDLAETLDTLRTDETVFNGGNARFEACDGTFYLDSFLKEEGLDFPKDSSAYRKLTPLFRSARLENTRRDMARVTRQPLPTNDPRFRDVFSHTPPLIARPIVTLGAMLSRFTKALSDAKRTEGTQRTYELPARILREVFGESTSLDAITREGVEQLFHLLKRAPSNATKRYPGLTLEQVIAAADKCGDNDRLAAKTLENYFNNIAAIFNFAVEKRLMGENPAKDRWLRASFTSEEDEKAKVLFTPDELNRLFHAPLFIGCKDDASGYATSGPNKPRRGRFWVPLLSLFHGFRCNEAAQLYSEDVSEDGGIPFFEIREEREDGSKCDKRLKTKQSKRRVPIHPEILKIGFLKYVTERKRDTLQPRLFPDLPCGASGYFSDPFSKFFGRFRADALGKDCKASFHSFRHAFRDALTEAGVPIPDVERLGGWELMQRAKPSPPSRAIRENFISGTHTLPPLHRLK